MAINVNTANNQANQLNNNVVQLRTARNQMLTYKSSVSNNWKGKEVTYITTAIDQVIAEIDSAIRNLESLSTDIRNTAAQIKREEEAAAAAAARARAEAAKRERIRVAQSAYDDAQKQLEDLNKQKEQLEQKMKKASIFKRIGMLDDLAELEKKIEKAQAKCNDAYNTLRTAKR